MTLEGVCVSWCRWDFGFFRVPGRPDDVFCHVSQAPARRPIGVGARVRFEIHDTPKGPRAADVELLEGGSRRFVA